MNKLDIAKGATSMIVGMGVTRTVNGIVRTNVPIVTIIDKVTVSASTFVVGSMAAASTKKYTDAKIDEFAEKFEEFKKNNDK